MMVRFTCFLIIWTLFQLTQGEICNKNLCRYTTIKKMAAADCYKMDIHNFPSCLRKDIEILDLTYNRIRKLKKRDASKYSYLKILYLQDNLVSHIDDDFFDDMTDLTALDLSINDIRDLPPNIFNLPSLSKLYLSQNANMNIIDTVEQAKPIKSPLSRLDISFNELTTLPDFGELVYLVDYNISGNNLDDLTPSHFAGMCNLLYLHNNNMTVYFDDPCDCVRVNSWLKNRKVKFVPFKCDDELRSSICNVKISEDDLLIYKKCLETHKDIVTKSLLIKAGIPCAVLAVLLILGVLYYLHKRKQRRHQRLVNQKSANNAKELNNLLTSDTKPKQKNLD